MKKKYICSKCNYDTNKWQGKCPECGEWNSFSEVILGDNGAVTKHNISKSGSTALQTLGDVIQTLSTRKEKRVYPFSTNQLNHFWNDGLVAGSLTLLAGEPGLGKSTLSLQFLRALWNGNKKDKKIKLLYITAEESVFELARRSQRLKIPKEIIVLQANNYEQIEKVLLENKPEIAVIDSIQTIFSSDISAAPGSVSQVSTLATQLMALSKSENIAIILVGHVTKSGQIAGPKTLEHLVDSVLTLESSDNQNYRTLSFSKHRFGSTSSMLLLKMEEQGLEIISDPSLALLENLETGVGVVYGVGMDKDLSLLVEIQALVSSDMPDGKGYGKRESLGFSQGKLNTIIAIIEKYLGYELKSRDVYVQITGLAKNNYDDSLDLPVLLAIMSSITQKDVSELFDSSLEKIAFAGRLTLSGKLRTATSLDDRKKTTKKLGFEYNPKIENGSIKDLFKS